MNALLVTSRVTFVPYNYAGFVAGLASCEHVGGLLVLDNAGLGIVRTALPVTVVGAWRVGATLLANQVRSDPRPAAFEALGKPVFRLETINSEAAVRIVEGHGFDLIVNARTRYIYKPPILEAPRLGCINVHHGLLPEQRGTMCDLWSLHEGRPAGFSIHAMTPKIDAGDILARVEVSDGSARHYPRYLARSAEREAEEVRRVLREIEAAGRVGGQPNRAPDGLVQRRNPTWRQVLAMKRAGLKL